jgi:hypothetical protein
MVICSGCRCVHRRRLQRKRVGACGFAALSSPAATPVTRSPPLLTEGPVPIDYPFVLSTGWAAPIKVSVAAGRGRGSCNWFDAAGSEACSVAVTWAAINATLLRR